RRERSARCVEVSRCREGGVQLAVLEVEIGVRRGAGEIDRRGTPRPEGIERDLAVGRQVDVDAGGRRSGGRGRPEDLIRIGEQLDGTPLTSGEDERREERSDRETCEAHAASVPRDAEDCQTPVATRPEWKGGSWSGGAAGASTDFHGRGRAARA